MASSTSSDKNENPDGSQDFISNMPDIVTEKILKRLPIKIAAQTSVLSRKWRLNWLSLKHLVFDDEFWGRYKKDYTLDWEKSSNIISNTLLHHQGQIHEFYLYPRKEVNISQWLSFLSRASLKKFTLMNGFQMIMPSHIYYCKELRKLKLHNCILNPPPFEFIGFSNLRSIELRYSKLKGDALCSLIKHSPKLLVLKLKESSTSIDDLVIEAPSLEKLTIDGAFGSLVFRNVSRLTDISIHLTKDPITSSNTKLAATIRSLASSCVDLQSLELCGRMCKILGAGGITESLPLPFNKLERLCLKYLDLSDFDVFRCAIGIIQSCPLIQDLEISLSTKKFVEHKFEYCNDNYKLCKLRMPRLTDMTGSRAELKLIEYLLAISTVLEKLFFNYGSMKASLEHKVLTQLLQFSRASTKAKVVCL